MEPKKRQLLFSVKKEDFELQFFRAGGKGGQKQNKTSSACRIIHRPSGARAECREERQQIQNKKIAFRRLVESKPFQTWLRIQAAIKLGVYQDIEKTVDEMMKPENLKIETYIPE